MIKLKRKAYMCFLWAALCLGGCTAKGQPQMHLEAKVQEGVPDEAYPDAGKPGGAGSPDDAAQESGSGICYVYVCGAVKRPGVFELEQGSRVYEAIALAGGLRDDAYDKGINQAQIIQDGDMIEVLTKKEQEAFGQAPKPDGAKQPGGLVNINTASAGELMALNGIGEAKAANIIAYREEHGKFYSIQEIMQVDGIGEGVYAKIQDKIIVTQ